jgi:hypothetical protein
MLLRVLKEILQSNNDINLLVTSRKEHDIQMELQSSIGCIVSIEDERVDADIGFHVQQCLQNDTELNKWNDDIKSEITTSRTSRADGM